MKAPFAGRSALSGTSCARVSWPRSLRRAPANFTIADALDGHPGLHRRRGAELMRWMPPPSGISYAMTVP